MKQKITPEQFYQLSERGKERLSQWLEEKQYGAEIDGAFVASMQIDIVQMIEFLDEQEVDWSDCAFTIGTNDEIHRRYDVVFCDALWEMVKEILERQN